jgi:hypothetical protein
MFVNFLRATNKIIKLRRNSLAKDGQGLLQEINSKSEIPNSAQMGAFSLSEDNQ